MEPIVWYKLNDLLWKKDLRVKQLEDIDTKMEELHIQREEVLGSIRRLYKEIKAEARNKGVRA